MRNIILSLVVVVVMVPLANADIYKQVRVSNINGQTVRQLSRFDIAYIELNKFVDIILNEPEFEEFLKFNIPYEIIHDDLAEFYAGRNPVGTTMGGFRTYAEVVAMLDAYSTMYPAIITSKSSLEATPDGNELWMAKVSDNPNIDEDEPEIFINGLHHAREPITIEVCLDFIKTLVENYGNDQEITELVDNNEFYIVPMVNPDGYEYNRISNPSGGGMWRKNRRDNGNGTYGVDLNRNYTYYWGYDNSGSSGSTYSETYRGPSPGSEPETQAMMDFIIAHDFAWIMNFHSYSNITIWTWNYYDGVCDDDDLLWELFGNYSEDTLGYDAGTSWQLLYNTNGDANDWAYGERILKRKTLALTTEIGGLTDGFWPSETRIPELVEENIAALLNYSHKAYEIYKRRQPPSPEITLPNAAISEQQFYIHWQTTEIDTFNLAQSYSLVEKTGYQRITNACEMADYFTFDNFQLSTARKYSDSYSLFSGSENDYRACAALAERLAVQAGDTLVFMAWYDIETDYDYAYVEASNDGGITWHTLNGTLSSQTNPNYHSEGYGITGSSSGWVQGKYYLDDFIGQQIDIRFRYWTDGYTAGEGIYIDDIYPADYFSSTNVLDDNIPAESLLVDSHTEGVCYFQVAARDDRGDVSVLSDRFEITVAGEGVDISGYVILNDSPANFAGSQINISGVGLSAITDSAGYYSITGIPVGTYNITAAHDGYYDSAITELTLDSSTVIDFTLYLMALRTPMLIEPVDGFISESTSVYFYWSSIDNATGYIIEIAYDEQFINIADYDSSLNHAGYTSELLPDNTCYWRVTAFNQTLVSPNSEVYEFTIPPIWSAEPPDLILPVNGDTIIGQPVDITWNAVPAVSRYHIEIADSSLFENIIDFDSTLTDTIYSANLDVDNIYWWRVKAANSENIWTEYSDIWYFCLEDTTTVAFLPGDANGDDMVLGSDVTYLVNYLRGINDPPEPLLTGDANGDCLVIGSDVTYLVNYFRGIGAEPQVGDCEALINLISTLAEDLINGK